MSPSHGTIPAWFATMSAGPCDGTFTTPNPDLNALRAHCARALSAYKVPAEFTIVDATAKTPGGKILRRPGDSAVSAERV